MKIQDMGFFVVLVILLLIHKRRVFVAGGLLCYLIAIPLFTKWFFFTAERLTWYGSFFLLTSFVIPKQRRIEIKY